MINRYGLLDWLQDDSSSSSSSWKEKADAEGKKAVDDDAVIRDIADEMLSLLIVLLGERYVPGIGQVKKKKKKKKKKKEKKIKKQNKKQKKTQKVQKA